MIGWIWDGCCPKNGIRKLASLSSYCIHYKMQVERKVKPFKRRRLCIQASQWYSLDNEPLELSLDRTLPCGQSFLWRRYWKEANHQAYWLGVVDDTIVQLYQAGNLGPVYFQPVRSLAGPKPVEQIKRRLAEFFNLHISYASLVKQFCKADPRFEKVAKDTIGARVLSLDPLECLCGYLCSSNNHIQRISNMMQYIAQHGDPIGEMEGYQVSVGCLWFPAFT